MNKKMLIAGFMLVLASSGELFAKKGFFQSVGKSIDKGISDTGKVFSSQNLDPLYDAGKAARIRLLTSEGSQAMAGKRYGNAMIKFLEVIALTNIIGRPAGAKSLSWLWDRVSDCLVADSSLLKSFKDKVYDNKVGYAADNKRNREKMGKRASGICYDLGGKTADKKLRAQYFAVGASFGYKKPIAKPIYTTMPVRPMPIYKTMPVKPMPRPVTPAQSAQ